MRVLRHRPARVCVGVTSTSSHPAVEPSFDTCYGSRHHFCWQAGGAAIKEAKERDSFLDCAQFLDSVRSRQLPKTESKNESQSF